MGHFQTSVAVMQKAATDIATAKATIDQQLTSISAAAEGTLRGWQGAGGSTLRTLMTSYDGHARTLQTAIDTFQLLLAEQAGTYRANDGSAETALLTAGGGLRM